MKHLGDGAVVCGSEATTSPKNVFIAAVNLRILNRFIKKSQ